MNWVDWPCTSADERMLPRFRNCVMGCCRVWSFFIDLSFLREQSPWSFSGLDSCVLAYCGFAAPLLSLPSFYNYARGHCEAAWNFFRGMHSVHLISVEQQNCAGPQSANCSGVCWEEGMTGGGVLVFQEVGTVKSLHWRCKIWFDCVVHICARVYVYVYVCTYIHVYVYVYAYLCIDCGSQYQCFSV